MLRTSCIAAVLCLTTAHVSAAQRIPTTIDAAEAEGAAVPRVSPASTPRAFTAPFGGTADRKCVTSPVDSEPTGGSLRSGDFIIRGHLERVGASSGLQAKRDIKILWMPIHNPFSYPSTLIIRGARMGDEADTLRTYVADYVYPPRAKTEASFASLVRFPAAGTWVVVATAGDDWGCFLLPVAD